MKIMAYLHSYPPFRLLGGELMTSRMLEALVEAGHDVTVLCQQIKEPFERNGVKIKPRRLNVSRIDLANSDVFISHPEIAHFVSHRLSSLGVPYVGIVHNLNEPTLSELRRTPPQVVVANAKATEAELVSRGLGKRIEIFRPPSLAKWVSSPSAELPRRFVTLVNLNPDKGGSLFYELALARPDLHFLGVSGGYGEQVRPKEVPPNVTLVGQSESMGLIYAMSRVLLMPSKTETYGMVGAEACLNGIPVIANPLDGIFESIGPDALYADRDKPDEWLKHLSDLDDEKFWSKQSKISFERGKFLDQRTTDDLARWVEMIESL
jgi:glycosyltransferase involved in cell wall biosynthesis